MSNRITDRTLGFTAKVQLDEALDKLVFEKGPLQVPGLGIIIYKDGREVYSRFIGSRHIDGADLRENAPITRDTRFRIASPSKQFTSYTLMQLVEQGRLRLDDDASKYLVFSLRNPAYPDMPITLEMLASHTSSLRDGDNYMAPPDVSIKEFFVPQGRMWEGGAHFDPKEEPPGQFFHYCNLNYGLLGTIIEKVTGERFDLYQKEHILKQLSTMADYVPDNLSREAFSNLGDALQATKGRWQMGRKRAMAEHCRRLFGATYNKGYYFHRVGALQPQGICAGNRRHVNRPAGRSQDFLR